MTTADMLRAEGEAKGLATGRAEHAAGVLVRLLTRKFGTLPGEVYTRIDAASLEQRRSCRQVAGRGR